ncbi:MFS transporter, partial [Fischerella thermalis CCMEE 5273]
MKRPRLLQNRSFILIWIASAFAMIGFSMYLITVSWHLANNLEMAAAVGFVLTAAAVPRVAMMLYGGILADRFQKSKVMFVSNLLQAITLIGLCVVFYMNALTFFFLLAFSFLFGLLDAFYWPASTSAIPTIVPKAELQRANSILQGSHTLFFIIGPILAGALIHHYSVGISFIVSALALILSALFVYPRFIQDPVAPGSIQSSNTVKVFREGMQYVKESPVHFWGMAVIASLHFFVLGPLINSFPILVTRLQGTALHLSYLEAGLGVGTFLGSL